MTHTLSGVYAAAVTPLRADLSADLDSMEPFLHFLAGRGCHGALLFGTTGEGPSFSPAERTELWRTAIGVRKKYPEFRLLAGTGTPSLAETIDLTKTAFDLGFDGVVTLPPYYFRKATDDGLFNWFEQVIRKSVPEDGFLLGYHIPPVAGIGFSLDLLARLKDAFPVQFAGIKDSSHDETFLHAVSKRFGGDLAVFNGTDSDLTLALENHASGCITAPANIISPLLRKIFDDFRSGRDTSVSQAAATRQRQLLEKYPPYPPLLKSLLARYYHQPLWPVRPPLVNLSRADEEKIMSEFVPG
jgi:4-hydroxy-tetrahydrodipicolinate synthase